MLAAVTGNTGAEMLLMIRNAALRLKTMHSTVPEECHWLEFDPLMASLLDIRSLLKKPRPAL
jgi:hypothetical protein